MDSLSDDEVKQSKISTGACSH